MKKKNAIIYIRVSTDDQAEKGFSLPSQLEKLQKYCNNKGWNVLIVFSEDCSAWKGFDRPEYNKLRKYVAQNKKNIDYILFTQWSRFSRDSATAQTEIKALSKLGIEANAIEQWVDLSIPENLYMLSFYLAAPQVENDRLSLRVKDALRRARKEGRCMGKAPYGYFNDKIEKIVLPDPKTKDIVSFAFKTFASGAYSIEEVRVLAKDLGLTLCKQQFINMLTNAFYIGKIFNKAFEDVPDYFSDGIHQPIVEEDDFYSVQRILENKRKPYQGKTKSDELPLKGQLLCPKCGRIMTGSASTGNGGRYHYYHCQRKYGCNNNFPAVAANVAFESQLLTQFKLGENALKLYHYMLQDAFNTNDTERETKRIQLEKDIANVQQRIKNLDDKLADNELPMERYNRLVSSLEDQENALIMKHATISKTPTEFKKYITHSVTLLGNITEYYKFSSTTTKQKIVGSIFPENIQFDGKNYRTTRVNEVFALACSVGKGITKKQPDEIVKLSNYAPPSGLEPETL